jgi:aerobic carbon-monoxide dehydrogenase small subunit
MTTTQSVRLRINGQVCEHVVHSQERLTDLLREHCHLTGTNQGCDTAQCGACTVLLDGRAVKACNLLALQAHEHEVISIEGLQQGPELHVMQAAFCRHEALQCGYCTPGMILRAISMHAEGIPAHAESVKHALSGNICRCTGYDSIVQAIVDGLQAMQALPAEAR